MLARVEEEVIIDREAHPIQETSRNLGPALLVVTFDAIFAFLALRFAKVPMIRDFGLLLAVGIAVICLCSIIVPVNQDSQVIHDLDTLERETGSSSELGVFVQADEPFSDDTVGFVHGFATEQLATYPDALLTASSVVTTVSFLMEIPGSSIVAPTGEEVRAAYEAAPEDIQRSTGNLDEGALNLIFRTGPSSLEERAVVVREIRDTVDPPAGVEATPSGLAVVGVGLLDNLEANRILLTYLAILFVFLFLAVRLRSVVRSLLSLVPVLIAVGTASLVAFAFSLKLSPMTAVGGPLVIAACTEFTSLILLRFVEERRRGLSPKEAVDVAASRTGRAFIVSALTAISGVAVIALSSLPLLRDFGIIVAMNVTVALLSALVVLPPMLVWADGYGWVSRGLVKEPVPG
jgi:predicted RND superfamily exporter protein